MLLYFPEFLLKYISGAEVCTVRIDFVLCVMLTLIELKNIRIIIIHCPVCAVYGNILTEFLVIQLFTGCSTEILLILSSLSNGGFGGFFSSYIFVNWIKCRLQASLRIQSTITTVITCLMNCEHVRSPVSVLLTQSVFATNCISKTEWYCCF